MGGGGQDGRIRGKEKARLLSIVDRWKNLIELVVTRWSCTSIAGCSTKEKGTNRWFPNNTSAF